MKGRCMNIIKMFLSSFDGSSFYTSVYTKSLPIFGLGDGRMTKKSTTREPITVWLNEVEDLLEDAPPAEAYLVEELGLFATKDDAEQAINDLK